VVETVGAISHSCDEDRHRCDLVGACEGGHHAAEVALRQRCAGIDTELRADGEEGSLLDGIQLLRAGTQVEVQVEVDKGRTRWWMNWLLWTTDTEDRR
jgi:hypothetical protein